MTMNEGWLFKIFSIIKNTKDKFKQVIERKNIFAMYKVNEKFTTQINENKTVTSKDNGHSI